MENKINPLSVDERLNLQREIKEAEQDKTTVEADADLKKCSKDTLDVSVIRKKRLLEIDAAQKLEAIKDRDKISKLINELESEIVDNMPTLKEQDVRPKNSADFERAVRKTEA